MGTCGFENQCLKLHLALQGSDRRANGAGILFFVKIWIFGGAAFFRPKNIFVFKSILRHAAALGDLQGVCRTSFLSVLGGSRPPQKMNFSFWLAGS